MLGPGPGSSGLHTSTPPHLCHPSPVAAVFLVTFQSSLTTRPKPNQEINFVQNMELATVFPFSTSAFPHCSISVFPLQTTHSVQIHYKSRLWYFPDCLKGIVKTGSAGPRWWKFGLHKIIAVLFLSLTNISSSFRVPAWLSCDTPHMGMKG